MRSKLGWLSSSRPHSADLSVKQKSGGHMSVQQQVSGTTIKEPGTSSAAARETIKVRCVKVRLEMIHIKAPPRRSRENHQMMEEIKARPSELH